MTLSRTTAAASLAFLFASLVQVTAGSPNQASSTDWRPLFDGAASTAGSMSGPGKFVIEDGVLRTEDGMGLLWYAREKLGDCVIRVVYKTGSPRGPTRASTSGSPSRPRTPGTPCTTASRSRSWTTAGKIAGPARSTRSRRRMAQPAKAGEWNTLEITLKGNLIQTAINGVPVAEFDASGLKPVPPRRPARAIPSEDPGPRQATSGSRTMTRTRPSSSRRSRSGRWLPELDDSASKAQVACSRIRRRPRRAASPGCPACCWRAGPRG